MKNDEQPANRRTRNPFHFKEQRIKFDIGQGNERHPIFQVRFLRNTCAFLFVLSFFRWVMRARMNTMRCGMLTVVLCSFDCFGIGDDSLVMMMERNWLFVFFLFFLLAKCIYRFFKYVRWLLRLCWFFSFHSDFEVMIGVDLFLLIFKLP